MEAYGTKQIVNNFYHSLSDESLYIYINILNREEDNSRYLKVIAETVSTITGIKESIVLKDLEQNIIREAARRYILIQEERKNEK